MEENNNNPMDYLYDEPSDDNNSGSSNSLTSDERKKKEFKISRKSNDEEIFRVFRENGMKKHYYEAYFHEARVGGFMIISIEILLIKMKTYLLVRSVLKLRNFYKKLIKTQHQMKIKENYIGKII